MDRVELSRRTLLKGSGAALTGWALLNTLPVGASPAVLAQTDAEVLPWVDQPAENPTGGRVTNLLNWEELDSWITPPEQFFSVSHYGQPSQLVSHLSADHLVGR